MMVFCQSHAVKLRIIHEDGSVRTIHYTTKAERDADRRWYEAHGFVCK